MNRMLKLTLTVVTFFLVGCATPMMATDDQDASAKEFVPLPGKSALYIYRNEFFGGAVGMNVSVNEKGLGQTGSKTYFRLDVPAGQYKIRSHAENTSEIAVTTESGRNSFVWQEVKMGLWMARSQLKQVDEATGRAGVLESKRLVSQSPETELLPMGHSAANQTTVNTSDRLKELQQLWQDKLISEDEYQRKRRAILQDM